MKNTVNTLLADNQKYSSITYDSDTFNKPEYLQRANEYTYARQFIDNYIEHEITENADLQERINATCERIFQWAAESYYESKEIRIHPLSLYTSEQMHQLVTRMAVVSAYAQEPEGMVNIVGQMTSALNWDDQKASVTTVSELLTLLSAEDIIDITWQPSKNEGARFGQLSCFVNAGFRLSELLLSYIELSQYLPPLVAEPKTVKKNAHSGYHTHNSHVVLNHPNNEFLSLDVINTQNKTALRLCPRFLEANEPVPNKELDSAEKIQAWNKFMEDSKKVYELLLKQTHTMGDEPLPIYFNHKYDSRGRMYCQGYHVSYQGSAYNKAAVELHKQEYIDVPAEYRYNA